MALKKYYSMHTKQEEFLCRFIERVGCMSFHQALTVLQEYYHCNEAQAGKVIMSLGNKRFFRFVNGQKYLRANSLMDNSKLDLNMVVALAAALDKCSITSEVESIVTDSSADHQLSLIADRTLYYILKLPAKDYLPKIFVAQNNFQQAAKIIAGRTKKEVFGYTTVFVFSSEADVDDVLDTIARPDLVMPHEIYFAKPGELYEEIEFERFAEDGPEDGDEEEEEYGS